jgi:hypothetical protein
VTGTGNGQLDAPADVAVPPSGDVYVIDRNNDRVQRFDANGNFLGKWGATGTGNGPFDNPFGLAADRLGNVYVADTENNRIQKFDPDGQFLEKWGTLGVGPGEFENPEGVAVDCRGNVYVADTDNNRVQKFGDPADPPPPCEPIELAVSAKKKQAVKSLAVKVSCGEESCEADLSGSVRARKERKGAASATGTSSRKFAIKPQAFSLAAGETTSRRIRFLQHKRTVKRLRKLLKKRAFRRSTKAKLRVTATGDAGVAVSGRAIVRLRR